MVLRVRGTGHYRSVGPIVLALALVGVAGCAQKGSVSGKVIYKGQPLPSGTVTFWSGKEAVGSAIAADGSYKVNKVPTGPVKITVVVQKPPELPANVRTMDPSKMGASPDKKPAADQAPAKYVPIPKEYEDQEKSGLTYTVTPGSQEHDIELPK